MIKAIIIENEQAASKHLTSLLEVNFPEVGVLRICESVKASIKAIEELEPDLVFMDVELNNESCFDLIPKLGKINFEIVFTSGFFDKYAKKAFEVSAIDFLEKPIAESDLAAAIKKYKKRQTPAIDPRQLELLIHTYMNPTAPLKLFALPTMNGHDFVETDTIVCCEGLDNQCKIHFLDMNTTVISRLLKDCETQLAHNNFCRVHKSYLINLNLVKKHIKGEDGQVIMRNDKIFPISRSYKQQFLDRFRP